MKNISIALFIIISLFSIEKTVHGKNSLAAVKKIYWLGFSGIDTKKIEKQFSLKPDSLYSYNQLQKIIYEIF